jgi:cytochrome c oxidase subunit 2
LRVKQDAVPGMTTRFWFVPTHVGTYDIPCAELCGQGHYIMRGQMVVESDTAFEAWLVQQPTLGSILGLSQ